MSTTWRHSGTSACWALETMQDAIVSVLEDIGSEIRLSFDYYENQFDQEVKEVYLSGGSVLFPDMDKMLAKIFNLETRLWDPMEALDLTELVLRHMAPEAEKPATEG